MARILITNDGPHSNETWAMATAEQLVPVDGPGMQGKRLMDARGLQLKIADALVPHHARVANDENAKLKTDANTHFETEHDASQYIENAVVDVQKASQGTDWEEHFKRQDVADALRSVLHSHFISSMDIHRQWHARRNPSDAGKAYLARVHSEGV